MTVAALAAAAVLGLAGWWAAANLGADDGTGEEGGARPIATLDAADVHSLMFDPADADHVFFGSHAGIEESRDGGFGWQDGSLTNADAMSLGVSPADPATLYAAGHDVFLVSRDGGQNWQPVSHDLPGTDIHAFTQDPSDPLRLYAFVAGHGVFSSSDGGATWAVLPAPPPGGNPVALAAAGTGLFAATQDGLVVSRDHGASWEALPAQPPAGLINLAIPAAEPALIYAGTSNGLVKSADGGRSWSALGPEGVPVLALAAAPTDPRRVLIVSAGGTVYRSDDGGATWRAPR